MWTRRRRIILVNTVDRARVAELLEHCRGLAEQGWRRVVIDASGVTGCDRAGLRGLLELQQGRSDLDVELTGACWSQFFPALQATPLAEITATHQRIRALLDGADPDDGIRGTAGHPTSPESLPVAAQRGRHRRTPAVPTGNPVA